MKIFLGFLPWKFTTSMLVQTESIFLQTEHRLSFCVNLEVVNFQDKNLGNIFVAVLGQTDFS